MNGQTKDKAAELLDIYDKDMHWIGTMTRGEAHRQGLWHQTFQCWIVTCEGDEPELLFQLRHPDKDTFPGLLDISCAGHLEAGETPADGVRELEEELGLQVAFHELLPCGIFPEEDRIEGGGIDREFCHIYAYRCDQPLVEYQLQPDEVTGLFRASISDVWALVEGAVPHIRMSGLAAREGGRLLPEVREVSLSELTPHPRDYYDLLFAGIRKLLASP